MGNYNDFTRKKPLRSLSLQNHNIYRQHHNVTASPRRSSSFSFGEHVSGMRQYSRGTVDCLQEWIEGRIDEDTRSLKNGGQRTWVTTMYFRFYLLLMNPKDLRS